MPDIREPVPDAGHETLRQAVVAALDDLTAQVDRIDRAYHLLLGSAHAAQATLSTVQAGQAAISALNIRIDATHIDADTALRGVDDLQAKFTALADRVAALEGHHVTLPGPDAAG